MGKKVSAAIIGASGYTGAELIRILSSHPNVELTLFTANEQAGKRVSDIYPHLAPLGDRKLEIYDEAKTLRVADVIFLSLPHGVSMSVAPALVAAGKIVIDLSGDFRLSSANEYKKWYEADHLTPELLGKAVYGLPETSREAIRSARFISCPGCYPTSVILGLAPALKAGLIKKGSIIIDSKSGTSGAGRSLRQDLLASEIDGSFKAYAIAEHKHTPEIEQYLNELGSAGMVQFTPHLLPIARGILSTIAVDLTSGVGEDEIRDIYLKHYKEELFVSVLEKGKYPATKQVRGSNTCAIGLMKDERTGRLIIVSAIDNLIKGASGQAVQCLNILLGLPEDTSLSKIGLYP